MSYRNASGTPGSYAFAWNANETFGFEPNSYIWDESSCSLEGDVLALRTDEGVGRNVQFSLYPVFDHRSKVELEFELRVASATGKGGALLNAGVAVHVSPDRVWLDERTSKGVTVDATGSRVELKLADNGDTKPSSFDLDATKWHRYRLVREGHEFSIHVDGKLKLKIGAEGRDIRLVGFGGKEAAVTEWRSVRSRIQNPHDVHAVVDWQWDAKRGFPDQFRRDRLVRLDTSKDSGYSGWTQRPDGTIVFLDYTNEDPHKNATWNLGPQPWIRAYAVTESDVLPRM